MLVRQCRCWRRRFVKMQNRGRHFHNHKLHKIPSENHHRHLCLFWCGHSDVVVVPRLHDQRFQSYHFPEWLFHYLPPCSRSTITRMPILTRLSSRRASEETEPPAYSELYSRDDSVMDRIVVSWIVNIICFSHNVNQIIMQGVSKKVTIRID